MESFQKIYEIEKRIEIYSFLKVPAGQAVGFKDPSGQKKPDGQTDPNVLFFGGLATDAPPVQNQPAAHSPENQSTNVE